MAFAYRRFAYSTATPLGVHPTFCVLVDGDVFVLQQPASPTRGHTHFEADDPATPRDWDHHPLVEHDPREGQGVPGVLALSQPVLQELDTSHLRFAQVHSTNAVPFMPPVRWVVESARRLWVVCDGAVLSLWSFDFNRSKWSEVPGVGEVPPGNSSVPSERAQSNSQVTSSVAMVDGVLLAFLGSELPNGDHVPVSVYRCDTQLDCEWEMLPDTSNVLDCTCEHAVVFDEAVALFGSGTPAYFHIYYPTTNTWTRQSLSYHGWRSAPTVLPLNDPEDVNNPDNDFEAQIAQIMHRPTRSGWFGRAKSRGEEWQAGADDALSDSGPCIPQAAPPVLLASGGLAVFFSGSGAGLLQGAVAVDFSSGEVFAIATQTPEPPRRQACGCVALQDDCILIVGGLLEDASDVLFLWTLEQGEDVLLPGDGFQTNAIDYVDGPSSLQNWYVRLMNECVFPFRVGVMGQGAVCESFALESHANGCLRVMALVVPNTNARNSSKAVRVDARDVLVAPSQPGVDALREFQESWPFIGQL